MIYGAIQLRNISALFLGVVFVGFALLGQPDKALAATETINCGTYLNSFAFTSCAGPNIVYAGGGGSGYALRTTYDAFLQPNSTYYIDLTTTGTGPWVIFLRDLGIQDTNHTGSGAGHQQFTLTTTGYTANNIVFDTSENGGNFSGTIESICISDTSYAECAGAAPPTPLCVTAFGTTTGCTYQIVDNPTLDFFLGIFLFIAVVGWIARYFSAQIHG